MNTEWRPSVPVPQTPFAFQRLPSELRNRVYEKLFVRHGAHMTPDSVHTNDRHNLYQQHWNSPVALLRTCKAIHEEAATILYSRNTFHFHDINVCCHCCTGDSDIDMDLEMEGVETCETPNFKLFLLDIGAKNRMRLRHLVFTFRRNYERGGCNSQGRFIADAFNLLARGNALRIMELEFSGRAHIDDLEAMTSVLAELRKIKGLVELRISCEDTIVAEALKSEVEANVGDMDEPVHEQHTEHQDDRDLVRHLAALVNERRTLEEEKKDERKKRKARLRRIKQINKLFEAVKEVPTELRREPKGAKKVPKKSAEGPPQTMKED